MPRIRLLYLPLILLTLLSLGLIYSWSVFVTPLEAEFGWQRSQTSSIFTISMVFLCLGNVVSGLLSRRFSVRIRYAISALLIFAGFFVASALSSLMGLFVCYGVMCSLGVGIGYNTSVSTGISWFPDRQGTANGLLLMSFGFGGSVLGSLAAFMMASFGWRFAFRVLGIVLGSLLVLSAIVLKSPKEGQLPVREISEGKETDVPTSKMVRDSSFIGIFALSVLFCSVSLGLMGSAAAFAGTMTENLAAATFAAGLVNIFNGAGRLLFGFVFDRLGSKKCLPFSVIGFFLSTLVMLAATLINSIVLLAVSFALIGFFFGASSTSNATFISRTYGLKYYAMNMSMLILNMLPAAFLGPYFTGLLQSGGGYLSSVVLFIGFAVLCFPTLLLVRKHIPPMVGKRAQK